MWNKVAFGNVSFNKAKALSLINFWDSKERVSTLSLEETKARRMALEEFKKWALMEETSWRERSREI